MPFSFKGTICGWICNECQEQLSGVTVRLYRHAAGANITALAVASASDTFAVLSDDQIAAKTALLIAETQTNSEGAFAFTLTREQNYNLDEYQHRRERFHKATQDGVWPLEPPSLFPPTGHRAFVWRDGCVIADRVDSRIHASCPVLRSRMAHASLPNLPFHSE